MIHVALQNALSVNRKHDRAGNLKQNNRNANLKVNDIVTVKITKIVPAYAIVNIEGNSCKGSIHISQLSEQFNTSITEVVNVGDVCTARVLGFDEAHNKWKLTLKYTH